MTRSGILLLVGRAACYWLLGRNKSRRIIRRSHSWPVIIIVVSAFFVAVNILIDIVVHVRIPALLLLLYLLLLKLLLLTQELRC